MDIDADSWNDEEITVANASHLVKLAIDGNTTWPLLTELSHKLAQCGSNTREIVKVDKWLKSELENASKSAYGGEIRFSTASQRILNSVELKIASKAQSVAEILIHTCEYVTQGLFDIRKGCETNNMNSVAIDVHPVVHAQYRCSAADPTSVDVAITDKITRFANLFKAFCASKGVECDLKPLRNFSDTEVTVYGRICPEGEATLDERNCMIQGYNISDVGTRAQVTGLHRLESLCLYPGQMVALSGKCYQDNFGIRYVATRIRSGIPVDCPMTSIAALDKFKGDNVHIMAIPGQLLTKDLTPTSFEHVWYTIKRDKPHLCIFLGPFVSVKQVSINGPELAKIGDIHLLWQRFLRQLIQVATVTQMLDTKFVLVPHVYDVISGYPLPQPPLLYNRTSTVVTGASTIKLPPNVYMLSNPGYIHLNGIQLGVTSCDLVSVLVNSMVHRNIDDVIAEACRQILQQRSWFPTYPASLLPAEYAIDHAKVPLLEFDDNRIPQVFLFASAVKQEPFAQFQHDRAFVSCHNNCIAPNDEMVSSITHVYITPGDPQDRQNIQTMQIHKRISVALNVIKQ